MAQTLVLPKLGLTMTEGTIVRWLKKTGDPVAAGDPLYELETDKLTNTVESTAAGILLQIIVGEGVTAPCLAPVAVIGEAGEKVSAVPPAPCAASSGGEASSSPAPASPAEAGRIVAAPAAKKLAGEKNVDLALVTGTGPGGRIVLKDVEDYLASPSYEKSGVKASPLAAKMAADMGVELARVPACARVMAADVTAFASSLGDAQAEKRVPMSAMRKIIARRMRESQDISPTVNFVISVDMSAMRQAKEDLAAEKIKVSYTDLLVKLAAKTLLEFPALNSQVEGEEIVYKNYVNMGIAVALPDGLLVPVVKNAHLKGLEAISSEIKELAGAAREGRLSPDALSGGTFTLTNLGMFGIESFTPIINQPEVAILGVNAITDTVRVEDGEVVVRPVMKLSLTADHRAVDGAVAAAFLARLRKVMEKPAFTLL